MAQLNLSKSSAMADLGGLRAFFRQCLIAALCVFGS